MTWTSAKDGPATCSAGPSSVALLAFRRGVNMRENFDRDEVREIFRFADDIFWHMLHLCQEEWSRRNGGSLLVSNANDVLRLKSVDYASNRRADHERNWEPSSGFLGQITAFLASLAKPENLFNGAVTPCIAPIIGQVSESLMRFEGWRLKSQTNCRRDYLRRLSSFPLAPTKHESEVAVHFLDCLRDFWQFVAQPDERVFERSQEWRLLQNNDFTAVIEMLS